MAKLTLNLDATQQERFVYNDNSFPFGIFMDNYSHLFENSLPPHWHDSFEFDYVLQGRVLFTIEDQSFYLNQGEAAFVNLNVLHSAQQAVAENTTVQVITFQSDIFPYGTKGTICQKSIKPIYESILQGAKISPVSECGRAVLKSLHKINNVSPDFNGYELFILGVISQLWLQFQNYLENNSQPSYLITSHSSHAIEVKKMLSYIYEHFSEPISIEELATVGNIGRTECFLRFRQYLNTTPTKFINDHRLHYSKKLLQKSEKSIGIIANECGFSSQSYFGLLFKEKYGVTPYMYRSIKNK